MVAREDVFLVGLSASVRTFLPMSFGSLLVLIKRESLALCFSVTRFVWSDSNTIISSLTPPTLVEPHNGTFTESLLVVGSADEGEESGEEEEGGEEMEGGEEGG